MTLQAAGYIVVWDGVVWAAVKGIGPGFKSRAVEEAVNCLSMCGEDVAQIQFANIYPATEAVIDHIDCCGGTAGGWEYDRTHDVAYMAFGVVK